MLQRYQWHYPYEGVLDANVENTKLPLVVNSTGVVGLQGTYHTQSRRKDYYLQFVWSGALKMWLGGMGVPLWLSSLGTLVITTPLNFLLNKFWAFGKKNS